MVERLRRQTELVGHQRYMRRTLIGAGVLVASVALVTLLGGCVASSPSDAVNGEQSAGTAVPAAAPRVTSEPVTDDPDDPAIWIHPTEPSRSLVLGTNKVAAPSGALVAFDLGGRVRQTIAGLDRPNNVDVEQRVRFGDETIDVAVVTERLQHRLRVFRLDPADGLLTELGALPVLDGESGDRREPMGIALYKRPSDGALFAIVAPKLGGPTNYLWQYRLTKADDGTVGGTMVRRFGNFSEVGPEPDEPGEIEAVVVDDALGYVYYSDERYGIRKWHADPDHADAKRELAVFGRDGYAGDREGLAIVPRSDGTGYLLSSDQMSRGTVLKVYRREGEAGAPHDHRLLDEIQTPADETDGIEATSASLPGFPGGLVVMMNSTPKNFLFFDWDGLERSGTHSLHGIR